MNELRIELLVGRKIVDAAGKKLGHIQEVIAEYRGGEMVVTEVHVGRAGFAERFSLKSASQIFTAAMGGRTRSQHPSRFRWEDVDFSDPDRPRLKLAAKELE